MPIRLVCGVQRFGYNGATKQTQSYFLPSPQKILSLPEKVCMVELNEFWYKTFSMNDVSRISVLRRKSYLTILFDNGALKYKVKYSIEQTRIDDKYESADIFWT